MLREILTLGLSALISGCASNDLPDYSRPHHYFAPFMQVTDEAGQAHYYPCDPCGVPSRKTLISEEGSAE